jgi:hypothetical protein
VCCHCSWCTEQHVWCAVTAAGVLSSRQYRLHFALPDRLYPTQIPRTLSCGLANNRLCLGDVHHTCVDAGVTIRECAGIRNKQAKRALGHCPRCFCCASEALVRCGVPSPWPVCLPVLFCVQEGKPRQQCYTQEVLAAIQADSWNFAAPGGESQRQLEERVVSSTWPAAPCCSSHTLCSRQQHNALDGLSRAGHQVLIRRTSQGAVLETASAMKRCQFGSHGLNCHRYSCTADHHRVPRAPAAAAMTRQALALSAIVLCSRSTSSAVCCPMWSLGGCQHWWCHTAWLSSGECALSHKLCFVAHLLLV